MAQMVRSVTDGRRIPPVSLAIQAPCQLQMPDRPPDKIILQGTSVATPFLSLSAMPAVGPSHDGHPAYRVLLLSSFSGTGSAGMTSTQGRLSAGMATDLGMAPPAGAGNLQAALGQEAAAALHTLLARAMTAWLQMSGLGRGHSIAVGATGPGERRAWGAPALRCLAAGCSGRCVQCVAAALGAHQSAAHCLPSLPCLPHDAPTDPPSGHLAARQQCVIIWLGAYGAHTIIIICGSSYRKRHGPSHTQ
jgi:hypothetical protein